MESLIAKLNDLAKKATEIKKIEDRKKNEKSIAELNRRFGICVQSIKSASEFIDFSNKAFDYKPSNILILQLKDSIDLAQKIVADDNISEDFILKLEGKNKKWNGANGTLQKEWKVKYKSLYSSIKGLMNIVVIADPKLVSHCQIIIDSAASYSSDLDKFINFKNAIEDINGLVRRLDLDDEIKVFLSKVGKEAASLSDINEKILQWIYEKGLASKMKVSFKNSK